MTKEEVKQDMKDRAEDAQIVDEQQQGGIRGWFSEKINYVKKHPVKAAIKTVVKTAEIAIPVFLGYKCGEKITEKKHVELLEGAHSNGIKKGIGYCVVEHSKASEEYKQHHADVNGLIRDACKNYEDYCRTTVNNIIEVEKKLKA